MFANAGLWPARTPDINPLNFYVCGNLKQFVYTAEFPDEA